MLVNPRMLSFDLQPRRVSLFRRTVVLLLLLTLTAFAERISNSAHNLSIELPDGWKSESLGDDPKLAFCLTRPEGNGFFSLRVYPGSPELMKAGWVRLRYDAVVQLGGSILSDKPYQVGDARGRILIYKGVASSGQERKFLRVHLLRGENLYAFHLASSPEAFDEQERQIHELIRTCQFVTAAQSG